MGTGKFFGEGHFLGTLARVSFSLGTGFSYHMSDFTCPSQTTVYLDKVQEGESRGGRNSSSLSSN